MRESAFAWADRASHHNTINKLKKERLVNSWNRNNRACTTTWTTLRVLDQIDEVFKDSGDVRMSELTFWNQAASADMRKLQATTIANQMDNIFRLIRRATYEEGVTREKAVSDMVNIMANEDKTVSDLSEVIDTDYLFWGEEKDE